MLELCLLWHENPASKTIPVKLLDMLFQISLWGTPGSTKETVQAAMRKVTATELPPRYRYAKKMFETKVSKAKSKQLFHPQSQEKEKEQKKPEASRDLSVPYQSTNARASATNHTSSEVAVSKEELGERASNGTFLINLHAKNGSGGVGSKFSRRERRQARIIADLKRSGITQPEEVVQLLYKRKEERNWKWSTLRTAFGEVQHLERSLESATKIRAFTAMDGLFRHNERLWSQTRCCGSARGREISAHVDKKGDQPCNHLRVGTQLEVGCLCWF